MTQEPVKHAGTITAPAGMITTLEAVVIKADGTRVDLGTIASSDPERAPVTPRPEGS